jgi:hypothetical protein
MEVMESPQVALRATLDFGHGQNTRLGWSDPTSLPRKPWWSLQPRCFARVPQDQIKTKRKGESAMSIINKPPEMVKREYELQEPIAAAVEKYATFIQSTPDHVVNSALKMVIWRDAEFRRWRKQQQTQAIGKDGHSATKAARA